MFVIATHLVCVYGNKAWSRSASIRETCCTPAVELLCVSFRPRYLPREFGQVTVIAVYVPPSGWDWQVHTQADSLEEATYVATDYFKFCEENIHSKTVEIFSNNKPWMTKELKTTTQNNKMKRK